MTMRVSVIVVSHGRPELLVRALTGLSQLYYRPFELVVVADSAGLAAVAELPFADRVKTAEQRQPNISAARNLGARLAAGDVLAFIDDDAVPEPTWLTYLVSAFDDPAAAAATGPVLGRNGISLQWGRRAVDRFGAAAPFEGALPGRLALKLEGTNMAIRRQVLADLGGFDEGFRFYLDETDLAFRLHQAGLKARYQPEAMVHHGFAESVRRRANRVPNDLGDIGRSTALYLRKHAGEDVLEAQKSKLVAAQSRRLRQHVQRRRLSVGAMADLMQGLEAGFEEGVTLPMCSPAQIDQPTRPFLPFTQAEPKQCRSLSGRWFQRKALMAEAQALVGQGHVVSLFLFSPTIRAHRVSFLPLGVWLQSGGLFGPSQRDQARFCFWRFAARVEAEQSRTHVQKFMKL